MDRIKAGFLRLVGMTPQAPRPTPVTSVTILFNKVNHLSLIAATLCERMYRERTDITVNLVDVRDMRFDVADRYLWIDCGHPDTSMPYVMPNQKYSFGQETSQRAWFLTMVKQSVVLEAMSAIDYLFEGNLIGKLFQYLVNEGIAHPDDDQALFFRYFVLAENWDDTRIASHVADRERNEVDTAAYAAALHLAYQNYTGTPISLAVLTQLLRPSDSEVTQFREKQSLVRKMFGSRCFPTQVCNRMVYQITTTGPEVFGQIRRVRMAKKPFMHVSTGSFGTVLYSSIPLPATAPAKSGTGGVLDLSPVVEPIDKTTVLKLATVA